eukprot:338509_1
MMLVNHLLHQLSAHSTQTFSSGIKKSKLCSVYYGKRYYQSNKNKIHEYKSKTKTYAILICGPDTLPNAQYNNLRGFQYTNFLKDESKQQIWKQYAVYKNQFPTMNEIDKFDGIIFTGSKHDAHNAGIQWIRKLKQMIKYVYYYQKHTKLLGICFGHQILANALNGKSNRNTQTEWELGTRSMIPNNAFFKYFNDKKYPQLKSMLKQNNYSFKVHEMHRDVVTKLPENAMLLMHSEYTDCEMYCIDNNVLGFQGHPEFPINYLKDIINEYIKCDKELIKCFGGIKFINKSEETLKIDVDTEIWKYLLQKWIEI